MISATKLLKSSVAGVIALTGLSLGAGAAKALTVTPTADGNTLASTILGSGVTISNISFIGGNGTAATNNLFSAGTFTDGLSSGIGIAEGILLTSGDVTLAPGPNTQDGATGVLNLPGDSDLNSLIPGFSTNDATILQFDFETDTGDLFFKFAFASEEYNEFTNSSFNDVFGFFLDGTNIALIPGTNTPVSINNVNGGNPFGTNASNPQFYNNNDLQDGGPFFNIEYDGFTDVFTASATGLAPGSHTIKLAIADAGDSVLDSGVFIEAGTFSGTDPDQPGQDVPEPSSILGLVTLGILGGSSWLKRRQK